MANPPGSNFKNQFHVRPDANLSKDEALDYIIKSMRSLDVSSETTVVVWLPHGITIHPDVDRLIKIRKGLSHDRWHFVYPI